MDFARSQAVVRMQITMDYYVHGKLLDWTDDFLTERIGFSQCWRRVF